ncbi:MAG: DUF2064 domain-containing protein [Hyphomicrobiaceae bacterium]
MAKLPVMGNVKTRLAREVGLVRATYFYRHVMGSVVARLSASRRWQTLLAVAPDTAVAGRSWPAGPVRIPQGAGDLGTRMQRLLVCQPPGPVIVVGTDIPALEPRHIAQAFRLLGRHDVVLGPAADGGFHLVGYRRTRRAPRPFGGVRWSSAHTLADTLKNLRGTPVASAAELDDVDDAGSLARVAATAGRRLLPRADENVSDERDSASD